MACISIELPYQYDRDDLYDWLKTYGLSLIKKKGNTMSQYIQTGDGLKSSKNVIARVVETKHNEVGEPFIFIANNKLTVEEMYAHFTTSVVTGRLSNGIEPTINDWPENIDSLCYIASDDDSLFTEE